MRRPIALIATVAALAMAAAPATAHNEGIPSVPLDVHQMEHVQNIPNLSGNSMVFFERRQPDGTLKFYAVVAHMGYGFDIIDLGNSTGTGSPNPGHPEVVGRYVGPDSADPANTLNYGYGLNVHPWVDVNPRRNIVALSIEETPVRGTAPRHNFATGVQFVDISDVTEPKPLGQIPDLGGPHTVRMIGDDNLFTSLNTYNVKYTDPNNPCIVQLDGSCTQTQTLAARQMHEVWEDPNIPGRCYAGMATTIARTEILDCSDPDRLEFVSGISEAQARFAHEVYSAPDSSWIGMAAFESGQLQVACPGGGLYFYDISGRHVPGAGLNDIRKVGQWFAPFSGATQVGQPGNSTANYGSCTMHSWQPHPERSLAVIGLYQGGTWVLDTSGPTQPGGHYTEFDGGTAARRTTWGNTQGNFRDALDYVNAAQWMPFDLENAPPNHERYVFVNGSARGLDVYRYTGPLPGKLSRLTVDPAASGGVVTGTLERYAVLTHEGWRNKPLAGQTLQVTVGETTVTAVTGEDGSFSADLNLAPGNHQVTVHWAGFDERFQPNTLTRVVTV